MKTQYIIAIVLLFSLMLTGCDRPVYCNCLKWHEDKEFRGEDATGFNTIVCDQFEE